MDRNERQNSFQNMPKRRGSRQKASFKVPFIIAVVVAVLAVAGAAFLYYKYSSAQKELDRLNDPSTITVQTDTEEQTKEKDGQKESGAETDSSRDSEPAEDSDSTQDDEAAEDGAQSTESDRVQEGTEDVTDDQTGTEPESSPEEQDSESETDTETETETESGTDVETEMEQAAALTESEAAELSEKVRSSVEAIIEDAKKVADPHITYQIAGIGMSKGVSVSSGEGGQEEAQEAVASAALGRLFVLGTVYSDLSIGGKIDTDSVDESGEKVVNGLRDWLEIMMGRKIPEAAEEGEDGKLGGAKWPKEATNKVIRKIGENAGDSENVQRSVGLERIKGFCADNEFQNSSVTAKDDGESEKYVYSVTMQDCLRFFQQVQERSLRNDDGETIEGGAFQYFGKIEQILEMGLRSKDETAQENPLVSRTRERLEGSGSGGRLLWAGEPWTGANDTKVVLMVKLPGSGGPDTDRGYILSLRSDNAGDGILEKVADAVYDTMMETETETAHSDTGAAGGAGETDMVSVEATDGQAASGGASESQTSSGEEATDGQTVSGGEAAEDGQIVSREAAEDGQTVSGQSAEGGTEDAADGGGQDNQ